MGYSPAVIGLSYVPQTIAFLIGGYGCRAALQKWQGYQLLPWLLGLYALSVIATWGAGLLNNTSLVEILIPFCVMAIANGAIYPIVVAQALRPFPSSHWARCGATKYAATGVMFPGKPGGFMAHQHAAADHHQRNALYRCSGGVRLQNAVSCRVR